MVGYLQNLHKTRGIVGEDKDDLRAEKGAHLDTLGEMLHENRASIEEEMNVAWASHELTSQFIDEITWWMNSLL